MGKIGLFGGTFDPLHNGHLEIAHIVKKRLELDKVIFIPAGNPPHKTEKKIEDAKSRLYMIQLAIENEKDFSVSDFEIKQKEKSYSVNLIKHFKEIYKDDEIYFVIGADSLYDMPTWWHYRELLTLCTFIVVSRPDTKKEEMLDKFSGDEKPPRMFFLDDIFIDISSTEIREKIKLGQPVDKLLPDSVFEYIEKNKLYSK